MLKLKAKSKYLEVLPVNIKWIFVFITISAALLFFYQYTCRQDLISYLSIAEKYYHGDFSNAVNGIWGPLISWLMIPLFYLNINPIISFKVLQIIIGIVGLYGFIKLVTSFELNNYIKNTLILGSIFVLDYYIFLTGTPDLLFGCILLLLVILLLKWNKSPIKFAAYSGLMGALLYFAKPYGFPFFIVVYIIFNIINYIFFNKISRATAIKSAILGLLVFIVISLPWIIIISAKYDKITFSTGGNYNFSVMGPEYNGKQLQRTGKLYEPVNQTAVSYWEDPTFLTVESWNPFDSEDSFLHLISNIINNLFLLARHLFVFSPLIFFLIFTINPKFIIEEKKNLIIIVVSIIYISGLLLLFIEQRFLIAVGFLFILLTGNYLQNIITKFQFSSTKKILISIVLFVSISFQPIYSLAKHMHEGEEIFQVAKNVKILINADSRIASTSSILLEEDWANSLTICYLLNSKFIGELDAKLPDQIINNESRKFNINYLLVWGNDSVTDIVCKAKIYSSKIEMRPSFFGTNNSKMFRIYKLCGN